MTDPSDLISQRMAFEMSYGKCPAWLAGADRASLFARDQDEFAVWADDRRRRDPHLAGRLRQKAEALREVDPSLAAVFHRAAERASRGAVLSYVI
jgi:hypothetical protein